MRNASALAPVPPPIAGLDPAIEAAIFARATAVDEAAAFPAEDIAALGAAGLLAAPLPVAHGGGGLGLTAGTVPELRALLTAVGRASLTVGRLFEGHVNAAKLVDRYGGPSAVIAAEVAAGRISGVWNAERGAGLHARRADGGWRLDGRKIHCSGAGSIRHPLVTARDGDDVRLFLPDLTDAGVTVDLSVWRANGMRGTATGTVDFAHVFVPDTAAVGGPGDYYRAPLFAGGAWRVLAVQLGGLERVMALHAARLTASGRGGDPVFRARFARAAGSYEAARLLVAEAGARAEGGGDAKSIDAYVDLARSQFEDLALAAVDAARRNVGLGTFIAPDPLDRALRDLETYLRQPFVDASRDHAARFLLDGGRFD